MRKPAMVLAAALAITAAQAQVVRRVIDLPTEFAARVTIDDAGTAVYAVSTTNQFGTNPNYLRQIIRWDASTGIGEPITDFEEGVATVSVSDDGTWLAFVSRADLLGTNHDESQELYVMHPDGTGLAQLTFNAEGGVLAAVISGSGNRIAFVGAVDPLGTNPTLSYTLFVVNRDGTNLRQLRTNMTFPTDVRYPSTSAQNPSPAASTFDISDDGSKLVYREIGQGMGGINADGTGNHAFSNTSSTGGIRISGNGTKVVYTFGTNVRIRSFDGNPNTVVALATGEEASITDDASLVYFYRYAVSQPSSPAGVWRIPSTGGAPTLVAQDLRAVVVAGGGGRIVARNAELVAIDNAGGSFQQLTTMTARGGGFEFTMSSDGHKAHFGSRIDPLGTNPARDYEYFSLDLDTRQLWQRTDASTPATFKTARSDDGSVFFTSTANPTGQNPCADMQLFRLSPGGAYTQLTVCGDPEPWGEDYLVVRPDGDVAVFTSLVGFDSETFTVHSDGAGPTQVSPSEPRAVLDLGVNVAGTGPDTWVAFTTGNSTAGPPGLFRVKADGTSLQQVPTGSHPYFESPSISADGSVVAWASGATYVVDATQDVRQLGGASIPYVTQDGQWVFSDRQRFHVPSNTSQFLVQGGGLPNATGSRWLLTGEGMLDGVQGGLSIFVADENAVPAFVVGKLSPTVLSWDYSPFSLEYDVIRGSIANLAIEGSTVSLGSVTCLEDDSPDNHTGGHGDLADPAPGEAFFFLYAGSVGSNAVAGSYGQGSGGRERVVGAGGCNP